MYCLFNHISFVFFDNPSLYNGYLHDPFNFLKA